MSNMEISAVLALWQVHASASIFRACLCSMAISVVPEVSLTLCF